MMESSIEKYYDQIDDFIDINALWNSIIYACVCPGYIKFEPMYICIFFTMLCICVGSENDGYLHEFS